MSQHGDYFEEPRAHPAGREVLVCQAGPFKDFGITDGYHYGQLDGGDYDGLWVRLAASPADMGLIRDEEQACGRG